MSAAIPEPISEIPADEFAIDPSFARTLEERLFVDTSEGRPVHLVAANNGAYIRLSSSAYGLLRQVAKGTSFDEIAKRSHRPGEREVSSAEVEAAYRRVVEQIRAIERNGNDLKGAFWLKKRLVSALIVARVAGVLQGAYRPLAAIALFVFIVAGGMFVLQTGLRVEPGSFWQAYALFIASLAAHEFGHASACARYGARPSEIGFTLYLVYPAFYSDVSAAWGLSRGQRVIVDLGGAYFQLVVGAAYAMGFALTGWEPLRLANVMIIGSCVFSLNPILKLDGYWVVADALGVTNLAKQPVRILKYVIARLLRRQVKPLPWSAPVTALLGLYAVASFGFWIWFVVTMIPALGPHLGRALALMRELISALVLTHAWPDARMLRQTATAAYVLLFPTLMFWRIARALFARLWQRHHAQGGTRGSDPLRSGDRTHPG